MKRNFALYFRYLAVAAMVLAPPAYAESNAGHALAQKFAVEEKAAPQPAKPQQKKMAETKPGPRAPAPGQDYEREMLDAAKAEAAQRQTPDPQKPQTANQPAPAAAPAQSPPGAKPAATGVPQAPAAKSVPQVQIKVQANVPATIAAQPREASGALASILVVLNQTGSGEIPKTFDPILCLGDVCYVSTGNETDARRVSRQDALSAKSSMATGAGACAGTPACAFRGVSLTESASAQIVDLGLVRHEPREMITAKIDPTCTVEDDFLACDKPIAAPDYRVWVVPEAVAAKAGGERIEAALDAELPEENVVLETDK